MKFRILTLLAVVFAICSTIAAPIPTAILNFEERGTGTRGFGASAADLIYATLITNNNISLVERKEMAKILDEAELNLSGVVNPAEATQVGKLTGAKLLITGSVFKIGKKTHIIAKIISTETSKVDASTANGMEGLDVIAEKVALQLSEKINKDVEKLLPKIEDKESVIKNLSQAIKDKKLPAVTISIAESHIGRSTIDPAAETELSYIYRALNGKVIDAAKGDETKAKYIITGEGFSEYATNIRNMVSVKARLEVKVVDQDGNLIAIDRENTVKVDLTEIRAGKAALQQAAANIAERIIPKLAQ